MIASPLSRHVLGRRAPAAFLRRAFSVYSDLKAQLEAASQDTVAVLLGPTGAFVGIWQNYDGSNIRAISPVHLYNANASTFVDGDWTAIGGASLPTWGTAGAVGTGGAIFDGSGDAVLADWVGVIPGEAASVSILGYPTITSATADQYMVAGLMRESGENSRGVLGGAVNDAGTWKSGHLVRTGAGSWTLGSSGGQAASPATDREILCGIVALAGDWGASENGAGADTDVIAGCRSGESDLSTHSSLLGNPNLRWGHKDSVPAIGVDADTGTLTLRVTHLYASGIGRLTGVGT